MVKRVMVGISEFRRAVLARAARSPGDHVVVTERGTPVGAFVPMAWYRRASAAAGEPTEY